MLKFFVFFFLKASKQIPTQKNESENQIKTKRTTIRIKKDDILFSGEMNKVKANKSDRIN